MTLKIDHTFVINLESKRWNQIQKAFKNTDLNLIKWDAVDGKKLDINKDIVVTKLCSYICTPTMIAIALSHIFLWKYIIDNKLDNVLILEDDAVPVDNFNSLFASMTKYVPDNWDVLLLGCVGPCDMNAIGRSLLQLTSPKSNVRINKHFIIPANLIGLHAYMLSHSSATKLYNNIMKSKIKYHVDYSVGSFNNINIFACRPQLIYQTSTNVESYNQNTHHYLLSKITGNIKPFGGTTSIDLTLYSVQFNAGIDITVFIITLFLFGIYFGYMKCDNIIKLIYLYYIIEIIYHPNKKKTKQLLTETMIFFVATIIGRKLH